MEKINLSPIFKPWVLSFALVILAGVVLLSVSREAINEFVASQAQVEHSHTVMSRLEHLSTVVERAETARRAYTISHDERHLSTYDQANDELLADLATLRKLTSNSLSQQQKLGELSDRIDELIAIGKAYIAAKNFDLNRSLETLAEARSQIDKVRSLIGQLLSEEASHLASSSEASRSNLYSLKMWMVITGLAFMAALGLAFFQSYREISQRQKAEQYLLKTQQQNMSEVHNLSQLGELANLLQACTNIEESLSVISRFIPRLVRTDAGALYMFRESRNLVERNVQWGLEPSSEPLFEPQDCWALRRGELHLLDNDSHGLACRHLHDHAKIFSLCIPIVAQGNVLGILYLENRHGRILSESEVVLAHNLTSQIALAMASIKLRETLRNLSVRDSLTGLYNRHYMEESLQRELASAQRKNRPLALVMMDLDYFKSFNDVFGHEAGDMLLSEVGSLLRGMLRSSDIACRFGGEEFTLIFNETEPEIVMQLVNQLREGVAALHLLYFGQSLGQISASFGLAFYPMHGKTTSELVRAADHALYRAKAEGRNRVEIAEMDALVYPNNGRKEPNGEPGSQAGA